MANEITVTIGVTHANGSMKKPWKPDAVNVTQTTKGFHGPVVDVGTSAETLSFGDISTLGLVGLKNLDATNFVLIGPDSGGSMIDLIKLKPGEVAVMRLKPGITVKAKADTASCKLEMMAWED